MARLVLLMYTSDSPEVLASVTVDRLTRRMTITLTHRTFDCYR